MNQPLSQIDPNYIDGWIEILHRQDSLTPPWQLSDLSREDFHQVDSNLPLQEFFSPIEVYAQFARRPARGFGIPREFRAFDAMNLCSSELNRIVTMILIPKSLQSAYGIHDGSFLKDEKLPLILAPIPSPFEPFSSISN